MKKFLVIGNPIEHSLSPKLHNYWIKQNNIKATYDKKQINAENIDYYNNKYKRKIPYADFRRNIITEGIELNNLIKKKIEIGTIKILPYELCKPCLHLEQMVKGKDIVKEFLRKGGLRCEVLVSGKVKIGDKIKIL